MSDQSSSASAELRARIFDLGHVLSVTAGRLLTGNGIGGVYDILNFVTGDSLYTHQLPRAAEYCRPWLLKQHPQLAEADTSGITPDNWREKLDALIKQFGNSFAIEALPAGVWLRQDPIAELVEMVGKDKVIVVKP